MPCATFSDYLTLHPLQKFTTVEDLTIHAQKSWTGSSLRIRVLGFQIRKPEDVIPLLPPSATPIRNGRVILNQYINMCLHNPKICQTGQASFNQSCPDATFTVGW